MGADYKYSREYGLYWTTQWKGVAVNVTEYFTYNDTNANVQIHDVVCPHDGIISRLNALANAAPGVGETFTYTLMVNGAPTALTCQIAGAVQVYEEDLVNEVPVQRGDRIVMRIGTSAGAAVTQHRTGKMIRRI